MTTEEILTQLTTEGLRIASENESGWTYTYIDDNGNRTTLWVTDL